MNDPEDGSWLNEWEASIFVCRHCLAKQVRTRIWQANDNLFERVRVRCDACGSSWWINGKPMPPS